MKNIELVQQEIEELQNELLNHSMYRCLKTIDDVKIFMELHVFAVWDFMSLLKSLQQQITTISLPWVPAKNSKLTRFVNEIVLAEESDFTLSGDVLSHFEMYLEAMQEIDADINPIQNFIEHVETSPENLFEYIDNLPVHPKVQQFLRFTFDVVSSNQAHIVASAFTFGREGIIPEMFEEVIKQAKDEETTCSKLIHYLDRHIELDGDEHGPLSMQMIEEICGDDESKWEEVTQVALQALQMRITLWDSIEESIKIAKKSVV